MERQRRVKNQAPSIDATSIPGIIEAVEGQPIKISLKVTGNPKPQVRWQIGRRKVKPSSKYRVEQDERGWYTLVINKSNKTMEEGVWAIATNDLGEDCCMVEVRVYEKENSSDESDPPKMFDLKPTANLRTQQLPHKDEIKSESEQTAKNVVVFGLGARKKKNLSLSKSFELDESKTDRKASKIDRSMVGEFKFFLETSTQKPHDLTKIVPEVDQVSSLHGNSRLTHKPPPLPARTKNDLKRPQNCQDKRKPQHNRWKKGAFGSHSFIATSSEVELNEDDDDEEYEEPVEAVRISKRKKKIKLSSVNASFESSHSSMNSVCLETNFDDCDPKLTEEKIAWQPETEFSNNFAENESKADDKVEEKVISNKTHQGNEDTWIMNGVKMNRLCHDLLSDLEETQLINCRPIINTQSQEANFSLSKEDISDFEMEVYLGSPKRRSTMLDDSLIEILEDVKNKIHEEVTSPQTAVDETETSHELKVYDDTLSSSNPINTKDELPGDENISAETSPSVSSDEDNDNDDDEEEEEEEEEEKDEEKATKNTEFCFDISQRDDVTTDDETNDYDGGVEYESKHSNSFETKENEREEKEEDDEDDDEEKEEEENDNSVESEIESQENSTETEISNDENSVEYCDSYPENSHLVTDVNNNNNNDDDNNNSSNNQKNSSTVKSTSLQFIDSEESDEDWPEPPSAEILKSFHSPFTQSTSIPILTTHANNDASNTSTSIRANPTSNSKENDAFKSDRYVLDENELRGTKLDVQNFITHTPEPANHCRSPTYRDVILERAGALGLASLLSGLKGFSANVAFKKVEFKVNQVNDKEKQNFQENKSSPTIPIEIKSSTNVESELHGRNSQEHFSKDKTQHFDPISLPDTEPRIQKHQTEHKSDDKIERKSGEKKSVRFQEDDYKLSEKVDRPRMTSVSPLEQSSHTSSARHDPNTYSYLFSNPSIQINGERQTKRFAFDEEDSKKDESFYKDDMTSPVTTHEYGELISFGKNHVENIMDELTGQAINEAVTNRCSIKEAVHNILKNRKNAGERPLHNLWSNENDRVVLPNNINRRLGDYPMFLSGAEREARRYGGDILHSHTQLYPGINNTNTNLPKPHFV